MKKAIVIVLVALGLSLSAYSADSQATSANTFTLGTSTSDFTKAAILFAAQYAKQFSGKEFVNNGENTIFTVTPDIDVEANQGDVGDKILTKIVGDLLIVSTTTVGGVQNVPNPDFFHIIPFAAGLETDQTFSTINVIGEVGYHPYFQHFLPAFFHASTVGATVQAGYSFNSSTPVLRLKGVLSTGVDIIDPSGGFGLGVDVYAGGWYRVTENQFNYRLSITGDVSISKTWIFDFSYAWGTGEPDFQQISEFATGLSYAF